MIFDSWVTSFNEGKLFLINAVWGGAFSDFEVKSYHLQLPATSNAILTITLFYLHTESVYWTTSYLE